MVAILNYLNCHDLASRLPDLVEILHDDRHRGPRTSECINLETGIRILPPGGVCFQILLWDHFSAANLAIFTKFGVYIDNGVLQRAVWSKDAFFENPIWRMSAISNKLN